MIGNSLTLMTLLMKDSKFLWIEILVRHCIVQMTLHNGKHYVSSVEQRIITDGTTLPEFGITSIATLRIIMKIQRPILKKYIICIKVGQAFDCVTCMSMCACILNCLFVHRSFKSTFSFRK